MPCITPTNSSSIYALIFWCTFLKLIPPSSSWNPNCLIISWLFGSKLFILKPTNPLNKCGINSQNTPVDRAIYSKRKRPTKNMKISKILVLTRRDVISVKVTSIFIARSKYFKDFFTCLPVGYAFFYMF